MPLGRLQVRLVKPTLWASKSKAGAINPCYFVSMIFAHWLLMLSTTVHRFNDRVRSAMAFLVLGYAGERHFEPVFCVAFDPVVSR